jgi:hypothetical protein
MAKSRGKRIPKTVLKLPNLEQSKSAVLNSLTSASSKRSSHKDRSRTPLSSAALKFVISGKGLLAASQRKCSRISRSRGRLRRARRASVG